MAHLAMAQQLRLFDSKIVHCCGHDHAWRWRTYEHRLAELIRRAQLRHCPACASVSAQQRRAEAEVEAKRERADVSPHLTASEWEHRGLKIAPGFCVLDGRYGDWQVQPIPDWAAVQAAQAEEAARVKAAQELASAEALARTGRVPYFLDELNAYGDVSVIKPGWTAVPMGQARSAPERYTIVVDWVGSKRWGYRPQKEAVVPTSWWEERQARKAAEAARPKRRQAPDVAVARKLGVPVARLRRAVSRHGEAVVERLRRSRDARARREAAERSRRARQERRARVAVFATSIASYLAFEDTEEKSELAEEIAEHAIGYCASVYYACDLTDAEKAERAARAYLRHQFTSYDEHLDEARRTYQCYDDWDFVVDDARREAAGEVDAFLRQRRGGSRKDRDPIR